MKNLNRTATNSKGQIYTYTHQRGIIEDVIAAFTGIRPSK